MYMQFLIFLYCSADVIVTICLAMCLHLPSFSVPANKGERLESHSVTITDEIRKRNHSILFSNVHKNMIKSKDLNF